MQLGGGCSDPSAFVRSRDRAGLANAGLPDLDLSSSSSPPAPAPPVPPELLAPLPARSTPHRSPAPVRRDTSPAPPLSHAEPVPDAAVAPAPAPEGCYVFTARMNPGQCPSVVHAGMRYETCIPAMTHALLTGQPARSPRPRRCGRSRDCLELHHPVFIPLLQTPPSRPTQGQFSTSVVPVSRLILTHRPTGHDRCLGHEGPQPDGAVLAAQGGVQAPAVAQEGRRAY